MNVKSLTRRSVQVQGAEIANETVVKPEEDVRRDIQEHEEHTSEISTSQILVSRQGQKAGKRISCFSLQTRKIGLDVVQTDRGRAGGGHYVLRILFKDGSESIPSSGTSHSSATWVISARANDLILLKFHSGSGPASVAFGSSRALATLQLKGPHPVFHGNHVEGWDETYVPRFTGHRILASRKGSCQPPESALFANATQLACNRDCKVFLDPLFRLCGCTLHERSSLWNIPMLASQPPWQPATRTIQSRHPYGAGIPHNPESAANGTETSPRSHVLSGPSNQLRKLAFSIWYNQAGPTRSTKQKWRPSVNYSPRVEAFAASGYLVGTTTRSQQYQQNNILLASSGVRPSKLSWDYRLTISLSNSAAGSLFPFLFQNVTRLELHTSNNFTGFNGKQIRLLTNLTHLYSSSKRHPLGHPRCDCSSGRYPWLIRFGSALFRDPWPIFPKLGSIVMPSKSLRDSYDEVNFIKQWGGQLEGERDMWEDAEA
ncbi:hypothetical protein C8J56DRAFT_1027606 [Mycena floridula]|nr:hypothetical protein C8J56DRAFT_1027606 [Mycena floridula]